MIIIKSDSEIEKMRASAKISMRAMERVLAAVKPGVSTGALDKIAYDTIVEAGAKPSFKGYGGFPGSICTSVNEQVVHGIPGKRRLHEGDIVSIDLGSVYHGYHSDMARTAAVGEIPPEVQKLIEVTQECFFRGIAEALPGNRVVDISRAIQALADEHGYGVVTALVGHGIGQKLHEEPSVPNYVTRTRGPILKPGMALAVEPMINLGTYAVRQADDGWAWLAADGKPSAHYENTIVIREGEPEILTLE